MGLFLSRISVTTAAPYFTFGGYERDHLLLEEFYPRGGDLTIISVDRL